MRLQSPLYQAIKAGYDTKQWDSKYKETTGYIEKIYARLP
jgi:hypothetical protein